MSIHNPYAPPVAEVDAGPPDGIGLCRDGKLVRMGVGGRFPDRCTRCDRPAERYRVERSVYWRPGWWRWTVRLGVVFLFVVSGVDPLVAGFFLLVIIGLVAADFFVRRKIVIEFGLCERHRRLRSGVMGAFVASWVLLVGLSAASAGGVHAAGYWWFWVIALAMFVLASAASALYQIRLVRMSEDHMWLRGAGRPFYEGLPAVSE